jgi:acetyl esterase/lipase
VPRVRSKTIRVIYWLVLAVSAILAFVAVWIVVPAPTIVVLPFGVVAPEFSPVLLAISLAMTAIAALYGRDLGTARLALVPSTLKGFDETMRRTIGTAPDAPRIHYLDLFRPPLALPSHIMRAVPFASRNGLKITLDIYRPSAGAGPFPIVLQIYGGAWQRGEPADNEWFARYFASRGYVVVAVDYRHAPQSTWPAQYDDVRDALHWSRAHAAEFYGDPNRIILLGRSSGAQLALQAAYRDASPSIKGVVSYYGPTDLAEGWRHPPHPDPFHVRPILEAYLGGTPAKMAERYREASPVTYAARQVPPTLLIYGTRDHIVEARFGRQLDRALTQAGATSVLLELPWSEHAFDLIPNGLGGQISLSYTEQFIRWALR